MSQDADDSPLASFEPLDECGSNLDGLTFSICDAILLQKKNILRAGARGSIDNLKEKICICTTMD